MPNFVSCLSMAKFGSFVYNFCKTTPSSITKNCKKRHEKKRCFTIFIHIRGHETRDMRRAETRDKKTKRQEKPLRALYASRVLSSYVFRLSRVSRLASNRAMAATPLRPWNRLLSNVLRLQLASRVSRLTSNRAMALPLRSEHTYYKQKCMKRIAS